MSVEPYANVESPIFLLGTGRCGSTYWQQMLCQTEDIWIWGEHEGILSNFSGIIDAMDSGSQLSKWCLNNKTIQSVDDIGDGDATLFAWNNGFDREILTNHIRDFISGLFKANLPVGKVRWGFKEIRYGPNSRIPELLLKLFPAGKIIVTCRAVRETTMSTLVARNRKEIDLFLGGQYKEFDRLVTQIVNRWLSFHRFFVELRKKYPERVHFAMLGGEGSAEAVLQFVGVEREGPDHAPSEKKINVNPAAQPYYNAVALTDIVDATLEREKKQLMVIEALLASDHGVRAKI
jgi:hypothetical protein